MMRQSTIACDAKFTGIGCHTGSIITITIKPSGPDTGISFVRVDISDDNNIIRADYKNVISTNLSTTIGNDNKVKVSTVEHLMSALWASHITNAIIEIDGEEVPIIDGSAEGFLFLINSIGTISQKNSCGKELIIKRNIRYNGNGDKFISVSPSHCLVVKYELKYQQDGLLSDQEFEFCTDKMSFDREIAPARTFCTIDDIKKLSVMGLGKGGSKDNALIIDGHIVLSSEGSRYDNEPARHKILDFIGDMYLSGYNIVGRFLCHKTGHLDNLNLLSQIFSDTDNYDLV